MNFFQMPNFLWDMDLDIYERVILTHIVRKTIGWGKTTDGISYSQFQKALGISRPKIVATIKKLEEKKIIQVIRQTTPQGHSINLYKIHGEIIEKANQGVVNENNKVVNDINKGSKSDLQGVVNDINKQNTSNTKYTITKDNNINIKKEKINKKEKKFFEDVLVQSLMNDLGVDEEFVKDLIFYRDEIEKPIKTISGLRGLLKEILNASLATKKSAYELAEIMKENEWKTIKASYIKEEKKEKSNEDSEWVKAAKTEIDKFVNSIKGGLHAN